ncbi:hypothetical protein [Verrucomicrobium spinosum]|uniref:hypothetical protein n=1 Tax=Verrucomicrobium spinosum TaxID=2736 RepID=UPI0009467199|nr:hypothetical protein [Verrucomicrobium spinosum]
MTPASNLPSPPLARLWHLLLWLLAWSPALVVLYWCGSFASRLPYHDSWAFVEQYQNWVEGRAAWEEIFRPHNGHPSTVGKLFYFAALHGLRGDVSVLPLLSWGFSLLISLSVLLLARPLWKGAGARGPVLMLLANLSIFTGAHGHTWIWDFVFQNFIPGACLMAGLVLLRPAENWRTWRWVAALGLSVVATNSFGSGFLVGLLLLPMVGVAMPAEMPPRRKAVVVAIWMVTIMMATWLAHFALPGANDEVAKNASVNEAMTRPGMAIQYVLVLLGHTVGQGSVVEAFRVSMFAGALLLAIVLALAFLLVGKARHRGVWRAALPWLICVAWAGGNAALICYLRMGSLLETALAPRYATFMLFMVLGVVFLVAAFCFHPDLRGLIRVPDGVLGFAVAGLMAGHFSGWSAGCHSFLLFHQRMVSEAAATDFVRVLPINPFVQWDSKKHQLAGWVEFLRSHERLKGVKFVEEVGVSQWRQGSPIPDKFASFSSLSSLGGGHWLARGTCGLTKDRVNLADLILISATAPGGEERFIALSAPVLPEDFHQRMLLRRTFLPTILLGSCL